MMKTRDQERATRAHALIRDVPEADAEKYGSLALALPMLVRTAGLVGALEFVNGRKSTSQQVLLQHIKRHLVDAGLITEQQDPIAASREADLPKYIRLTHETLAALLWHKRFTHSVLKVESGKDLGES